MEAQGLSNYQPYTLVSNSNLVSEHHKRLHSIDESISQGSGKIQKMLNEGFHSTESSLAALSNKQYNGMLILDRCLVQVKTDFG